MKTTANSHNRITVAEPHNSIGRSQQLRYIESQQLPQLTTAIDRLITLIANISVNQKDSSPFRNDIHSPRLVSFLSKIKTLSLCDFFSFSHPHTLGPQVYRGQQPYSCGSTESHSSSSSGPKSFPSDVTGRNFRRGGGGFDSPGLSTRLIPQIIL